MLDLEGFSLAQEPFDDWFRDGEHLFRQHMVKVGDDPDAYKAKNLRLLKLLDTIGLLQVTTARCNGRMFGYLVAVLSPSLDDPDVLEATHTAIFASPDAPGIGMKLIQASLDALRAKGVHQAIFRAGIRGDGPRLGALYRRAGARDFGSLHVIDLERE